MINLRKEDYKGSRSLTHKWKSMQFSQYGDEADKTGINNERALNIAKSSVYFP